MAKPLALLVNGVCGRMGTRIVHLAQIAAIANEQLALQKVPAKHKNVIRIISLEPQQRKQELARMLAGDISEISLKHAEELMTKYK